MGNQFISPICNQSPCKSALVFGNMASWRSTTYLTRSSGTLGENAMSPKFQSEQDGACKRRWSNTLHERVRYTHGRRNTKVLARRRHILISHLVCYERQPIIIAFYEMSTKIVQRSHIATRGCNIRRPCKQNVLNSAYLDACAILKSSWFGVNQLTDSSTIQYKHSPLFKSLDRWSNLGEGSNIGNFTILKIFDTPRPVKYYSIKQK